MKKNIDVNIRMIENAYRDRFKSLFACAYLITANERKAESVIMKVIKKNNLDLNGVHFHVGSDSHNSEIFVKAIKKARSVIWNGPMGVFENDAFSTGTLKVAKAVAKCHGTTIVGGGDSVSALVNMGLSKKISHISTGGGASLKLFEGKVLPAVDIIENKII